jgi:zinc protease
MKLLSLALALAVVVAAACVGNAARAAAPRDGIEAPAIDFHRRVLANGLKVYSLEDHSTTNVAVQIWYGVGDKNDPPGRAGMAHLLEHLMFKGSRGMPPEFIDRLTDDVGGENDASTDEDSTEYDEVVPANYLERLLWAEAQRMTSLDVSASDFAAERAVVEQELLQDEVSDPYSRLFDLAAPRASIETAAYRRSVGGSLAEIEAATPAEVAAFHTRYYRPDNASLVVVGDFNQAQLDRWIDTYFGAAARPSSPVPRAAPDGHVRRAHRVVDGYAPEAPSPALLLTYPGPAAASPDAAALKVLDAVLTLDQTSRVTADLVSRRKLASGILSEVELWRQDGRIEVGATLEPGVSMRRGEAALRAELGRLRSYGVSKDEVLTAKRQLLAELLRDRQTIDGIASAIGEAAVLEGDAGRVNSDVKALAAVTAADVRRVANAYLVDARRTTIRYHDRASPGATDPVRSLAVSAGTAARDIAAAVLSHPTQSATAPLPPAGIAAAPVAPTALERTLPNGVRVIVARTGSQPIVTAELTFIGGSALDPEGKAGLAYLTASLADGGLGGKLPGQRTRALEQLGDTLTAEVDYDSTSFRLSGLAALLPAGLETMAGIVRHPQVGQAAFSDVQALALADSVETDLDGDSVSEAAVGRLVFGRGAYGHLASGAPRPSARITAADVRREAAALYRPQNAILVVTGGIDPDATLALAAKVFGDWASTPAPQPPRPAVGPLAPGRVIAIDAPGREEATVTIATRSIARSSPSYYAVELANELIGGGESSRLAAEIRVRRALTYDAHSQLDVYRDVGLFSASAQTQDGAAPDVALLMMGQLTALARAAPPPDELAARKAELIGAFYRDCRTSDGAADLLTENAVHGVDVGEMSRYAARIDAVSAEDVRVAAAQFADPAALNVVIVGDAARFKPSLRSDFPKATLVRPGGLNAVFGDGRDEGPAAQAH